MAPTEPKKKSLKVWIILLVLPFALLLVTAAVQFAAQYFISDTVTDTSQPYGGETTELGSTSEEFPVRSNPASTIINIISVLIGTSSVLMIVVGTPIWIVMLVRVSDYNKRLAHVQTPPKHDV